MAAVAVLQPKDSVTTNGIKYRRVPKPNPRSDRRKRSPSGRNSTTSGGTTTTSATTVPAAKSPVMGQIKILKRGEDIVEAVKATALKVDQKSKVEDVSKLNVVNLKDDLVLSTTDRLGPEPEMVPKLPEMYAGSAFFDSPPPSSLPIPAFFAKEKAYLKDPTMDLLRLLRLNL